MFYGKGHDGLEPFVDTSYVTYLWKALWTLTHFIDLPSTFPYFSPEGGILQNLAKTIDIIYRW